MTNPTDSTSPFSDNPSNQNPLNQPTQAVAEEFSIRTMGDDLMALQKNSTLTPSAAPPMEDTKKIIEQPLPAPEPQEKRIAPEEVTSEIIHPFSEQVAAPKKETANMPAAAREITEIPAMEELATEKESSAPKIIIAIIIVLVIAIIGLGTYYFLTTRAPKQAPVAEQPVVETPVPTPTTPAPIEEPVVSPDKYLTTKPNYLSLDLATITPADITKTINNVSLELKSASLQSPYEFIVVDANNNPIAFPIFATAAKLNLSPMLLSSLGENFSLYLYNDGDNSRMAVSTTIAKKDVLTSELTKQEKTFANDASFLFLGAAPEITTGTFGDSDYKSFSIRFLNLNAQKTLSIDYTINNSQLIIASSKNTLRAVLDKISQQTTASASTQESKNTANQTIETCTELPNKLASCLPYICSAPNPITGELMKNEIAGIVDGKCNYVQQMPNNGKMECKLTADMQKKISMSLKDFSSSGKASFSAEGDATTKTTSTVNGQVNPLQEALETNQCVISGY